MKREHKREHKLPWPSNAIMTNIVPTLCLICLCYICIKNGLFSYACYYVNKNIKMLFYLKQTNEMYTRYVRRAIYQFNVLLFLYYKRYNEVEYLCS